ncbi:membrane or secreted protein [Segetibacter sp. 3557_3]|uniref:membrane or secreted protein n=1 Tax=Segetibacter sp. 3557_3 TaxID=2547429 RepID=UPI0010583DC2|nr:membrane or secreted protein [Segetibacter sp. 3557_3]TDH21626.1 membrane or secreted protein [Segetibacter sp. 3557_3]
MKMYVKCLSACIAIALVFGLSAFRGKPIDTKDMLGAWGFGSPENRTVMIMTDKVFSVATYDLPGKKFISSYGGSYRINGNKLVKIIEWNSKDSSQVGKEMSEDIQISGNKLSAKTSGETWDRLDNGKPGELMGAWIITGNFTDDKAVKRANPFYPRRTMKILSGKYFQWIAYNVGTKSFMNAGGGTYTTANGKYTENVEFFTKTAESVGKTLQFDYSFVNGDWRHRGQKSTGGAMDECWSKRETLEK